MVSACTVECVSLSPLPRRRAPLTVGGSALRAALDGLTRGQLECCHCLSAPSPDCAFPRGYSPAPCSRVAHCVGTGKQRSLRCRPFE